MNDKATPATPNAMGKQVAALLSSSAVVLGLAFLLTPVVSRIYAPEELGVLSLFLALTSVIAIVGMASYDAAVVVASTPEEAAEVALGLLGWAALVSVLGAGLVAVIAVVFDVDALGAWEAPFFLRMAAVAASSFLIALAAVVTSLSVREQRFGALSRGRIAQSLTTQGTLIGLGLLGVGATAVVAASIAGQCIFVAAVVDRNSVRETWGARHRRSSIAAAIRKHAAFPLYNLPQLLLETLRDAGIVWAIGATGGAGAVGQYAMVNRVARGPLTLVTEAFNRVFFANAAQLHNDGHSTRPATAALLLRLGSAAAVGVLVTMLIAPDAFAFLFGERWRTAGEYARILAPWLFTTMLAVAINALPNVKGRQRTFLFFALAYNVAFLIAVVLCSALRQDTVTLLVAVSAVATAAQVSMLVWLYRLSGQDT